jgi:N-methylhydantoinase B
MMPAYHRPRSLAEALALRAAGEVLPLAGGTDVYPARTARLAWGDPAHPTVLDLTAIPGLGAIEEDAAGWRIGCLVTWAALRRAALPPLFDGLRAASREVGGPQVQNRGTLVGNLVTASPAGDGIPNLLALDAEVEIAGPDGTRLLPVARFITGRRRTALRPEEIVTALRIPRLAGAQGGFEKLGARRYLVISIAMAAGVVVADAAERIAEARLALGACSPVALRLPLLEAALEGVPLAEAWRVPAARHVAALAPIDDVRASAAYRREAAVTLLSDLLRGLA